MTSKLDQKTFIITMFIILVTWASQAMSRAMLQEASIVELHEKWMAQFGRTYVDGAEKDKRFKIFKENYEYVERFNNAGNNTYKLGINGFSYITDEEFQASHTGSKMSIGTPRFSKTISSFYCTHKS
ncbi:hypothetical protein LWI28_028945 [Acer negundo]|uniref:Cathepsin propeptide inhibitor domain-containing protein n=1 Tax=Acer negundo TaxID=4023 RepID=A0AAD5JRV0_ACENE|nr:hypothetical protein LWI28_028945 [Acer negundo]